MPRSVRANAEWLSDSTPGIFVDQSKVIFYNHPAVCKGGRHQPHRASKQPSMGQGRGLVLVGAAFAGLREGVAAAPRPFWRNQELS